MGSEMCIRDSKQGSRKERMIVETRLFPVEGSSTSEGSLIVSPLRTLYATVGEGDAERGWVIETYYHPLVSWIWAGAFMMAFGGFVSLADQRLRTPERTPKRHSKTATVS